MTVSSEILVDSPLAYWQMTEASGSFADSSGNARTLVPSNVSLAQTPPAGPFSDAPLWNGTNAFASLSLDLSALSAITTVFWIAVMSWPGSTSYNMLLEHTNNGGGTAGGFATYSDNFGDGLENGHYGSGFTENSYPRPAAPTGWKHLAVVHDFAGTPASGEIIYYVNGVLQTIRSTPNATDNLATQKFANSVFHVGSRANSSLFANFYMRHLAVFPSALSAARILTQYNAAFSSSHWGRHL